jgi:Zn-dependent alcohol dehydrogenase
VSPLITSTIGIDGIAAAIEALRAGSQVKVIIEH